METSFPPTCMWIQKHIVRTLQVIIEHLEARDNHPGKQNTSPSDSCMLCRRRETRSILCRRVCVRGEGRAREEQREGVDAAEARRAASRAARCHGRRQQTNEVGARDERLSQIYSRIPGQRGMICVGGRRRRCSPYACRRMYYERRDALTGQGIFVSFLRDKKDTTVYVVQYGFIFILLYFPKTKERNTSTARWPAVRHAPPHLFVETGQQVRRKRKEETRPTRSHRRPHHAVGYYVQAYFLYLLNTIARGGWGLVPLQPGGHKLQSTIFCVASTAALAAASMHAARQPLYLTDEGERLDKHRTDDGGDSTKER